MTAAWEKRPLGEVCTIQNGYAFDSKKFTPESGTPLIRIRDLKGGYSTETNFDGEFDPRYVVKSGTFLIGMDGDFACHEWKGEPALLNQRVCRIELDESRIHPRFLFYGINKHLKAIEDVTGFSTVKHLSSKRILGIEFSFPPLEEQKHIVAILDAAFADIDQAEGHTQGSQAKLTELQEDALWREFEAPTGRHVVMAEVCSIDASLVDPRAVHYADMMNVGAGNIQTGTGRLSDLRSAREEGAKSNKFAYVEGAVLYSKIRPYLRKVARPGFLGLCSADIYPLTPKQEVMDRDYLYWLLLSPQFTSYAVAGSARAGMPKVNRPHLFAYEFQLPTFEAQVDVASRLDALHVEASHCSEVYETKRCSLTDLRQSLLHQAFSGQL